uniref:Uncharacterized protein n=1 Tax=Caenorhabditis japonica TaxID=281687 RepID=A0A8R1IUS2_CAEJA
MDFFRVKPMTLYWSHIAFNLLCLIYEVRASNANQKFAQLEAARKSIPMTVVQTLLDLMPRRCQAVIDAKGYPTKY